MKYTVQ